MEVFLFLNGAIHKNVAFQVFKKGFVPLFQGLQTFFHVIRFIDSKLRIEFFFCFKLFLT